MRLSDNLRKDFIAWFEDEKNTIEQIYNNVILEEYGTRELTPRDLHLAAVELKKLSDGGDADYGFPNLDLAYISWYSFRRITDNLLHALEMLSETNSADVITVYDMGAGSMSVAWAILIASKFLKSKCIDHAFVHYYPNDNSNWASAINKAFMPYFAIQSNILIHPSIMCEWHFLQKIHIGNCWVVLWGSYPFSESDKHNLFLGRHILRLLERCEVDRLIITTSRNKQKLIESIKAYVANYKWRERDDIFHCIGTFGKACLLTETRKNWFSGCSFSEEELRSRNSRLLLGQVTWDSTGYYSTVHLSMEKM